jgi:hypothetical protein
MNKAKFTSAQVGEVLQRLRNSEINFKIEFSQVFENGIGFAFGNSTFGFRGSDPESLESASVIETIDNIAFNAAVKYPNSAFAAWYNGRQGNGEPGASEPIRETVNA